MEAEEQRRRRQRRSRSQSPSQLPGPPSRELPPPPVRPSEAGSGAHGKREEESDAERAVSGRNGTVAAEMVEAVTDGQGVDDAERAQLKAAKKAAKKEKKVRAACDVLRLSN